MSRIMARLYLGGAGPLADVSSPLNFDKWYSVQDINVFAPPP